MQTICHLFVSETDGINHTNLRATRSGDHKNVCGNESTMACDSEMSRRQQVRQQFAKSKLLNDGVGFFVYVI